MRAIAKVGIGLVLVLSTVLGTFWFFSPSLGSSTTEPCGETIRVYRMTYGTPITGLAIMEGSNTLVVTNSTGSATLGICRVVSVTMTYNAHSYSATLYPHQVTSVGLP